MSTKIRAAIAAAVSGTAGAVAGLTASHHGLSPDESVRTGAAVSGAVGNLLYQAFRLTPDDTVGGTGTPTDGESDNTNADNGVSDTANTVEETDEKTVTETDAMGGMVSDTAGAASPHESGGHASAPDRKRLRHRKLERGERRRVQRRERNEQDERRKENGHGAS